MPELVAEADAARGELHLEALAAVRSLMPAETAQARGSSVADSVQREAFESFSAPGGGLPDPLLEWKQAIVQTGRALTSLFNPRLGDEIGRAAARGPEQKPDRLFSRTVESAAVRSVRSIPYC